MRGHADWQDDGALGAKLLCDHGTRLDRRALAGDHDLTRGVPIGHDERSEGRRSGDKFRETGVVETDEGGHRAVTALPGGLHQLAASAHQPNTVCQGQGAGGHEGGILAHRMTGREGRGRRDQIGGGPALTEGLKDRDRRCKQGGLGVLRAIQALGRAVPRELADRLAKGGVGSGEDRGRGGGGHGKFPAHAHRLRALAGEHEGDG